MFDLAIEDYNLWIDEVMPVLLVLFDTQKRRAWRLYMQRYFAEEPSRVPKKGAKTVASSSQCSSASAGAQ